MIPSICLRQQAQRLEHIGPSHKTVLKSDPRTPEFVLLSITSHLLAQSFYFCFVTGGKLSHGEVKWLARADTGGGRTRPSPQVGVTAGATHVLSALLGKSLGLQHALYDNSH